MREVKLIFGLAVFVLVGTAAWQIGACEVANTNLQDDLRDMGAQVGTHIGMVTPNSDEEMNRAVIHKAKEHGVELSPVQVMVRRIGSGERTTFYLAADYTVPVNLGLFSFQLHFTPSSDKI
jgi:hypothetical protein